MGSSHSSHTNLGSDSTSFEAGLTGSKARWKDSFEVSTSKWKENDHTNVWGVEYKAAQQNHTTCGFQLTTTNDDDDNNNGINTICFGLCDTAGPENKTQFALKISRVARDGLSGGISGVHSTSSSYTSSPKSFTRTKNDYTIETTIVSYGCSYRDGLFVLEMKKKLNSENACTVTLAHYYVTKQIALSVSAKIHRKGNVFVVDVEGPIKHPSVELRKVVVKTSRTGDWSPGSCSHCKAAKASKRIGDSNSLLKDESQRGSDVKVKVKVKVGNEIVKQQQGVFSSKLDSKLTRGLLILVDTLLVL